VRAAIEAFTAPGDVVLDPFVAATVMPRESFSGSLSAVPKNASRAGQLRGVSWLAPVLLAERFHQHGSLLGLWGTDMPDGVSHIPPAHEMIDPPKDTTALIAQMRAGFVPQPEAAGAFGYDFRAAVEMIREANALLDDAGLALDTDPRRVAKSGAAQDAAQMAAVEIAATGAAAPPRTETPAQD
jgi:capsid protein